MEFQKSNNSDFYIRLNKKINDYFKEKGISRYANAAFWIKGIAFILLHITAYAGIFYFSGNLAMQTLSYLFIGFSSVMVVFNIVHDASHGTVSKNQNLNKAMTYLGDLIGINTYIWDIRHNVQHHSFTNVPDGDLIIDYVPLIRLTKHQSYKWFHKYQTFYAPILYMLYSFYWVMVIDISLFTRKNICNLKNIKHSAGQWLILIAGKALYISMMIVLPYALTDLSFVQTLLLFMSSHLIAGMILSPVAVLGHFVEGPEFPSPENGKIPGSWAEHELATTIDFAASSRLTHTLTGGLNTHIAHHLFPRINHIHYYEITKIIEDFCKKEKYPYHKENFLKAMGSHFRYLRGLSKN